MIRKGLKLSFKPAFDRSNDGSDYRRILKFRRSWVAIGVLAAFDLVFLIPAITTFQQAAAEWARFDDLFDLVGALFLTAWLLGWSIGPLLMTTILVLLLFGREVIKARNGRMVIFLGIPGIGVEVEYSVASMRNARFEKSLKKSARSWRGSHMLFDYGANTVAVGSRLSGDDMIDIKNQIQAASGQSIRRGEATDEELAGTWEPVTSLAKEVPLAAESDHGIMTGEPLNLTSPSSLLLILANLVPIAGAVFLGWDLGYVMVLYWAESAVIGFFNICKIIVIGRWFALLAAPFFAGHFGGFMAIHFLFLYGLFVQGFQDTSGGDLGGDLSEVVQMFATLWPALLMLFISHAFSFYVNFLGRNEFRGRTVQNQMSEPYKRIIFMHLALIFGGGLTMVLGDSTPVLMLVIAAKIWVDLKAHLKQHVSH